MFFRTGTLSLKDRNQSLSRANSKTPFCAGLCVWKTSPQIIPSSATTLPTPPSGIFPREQSPIINAKVGSRKSGKKSLHFKDAVSFHHLRTLPRGYSTSHGGNRF